MALPNSITTIGERAFDNAKKLTLSKLPTNLTVLGVGAFANCDNIAIATLPINITTIPSQCFALCPNLAITDFGKISIGDSAFIASAKNDSSITRLDMSQVTSIGSGIFVSGGYPNVTEIVVPENLFGYIDESALTTALFGMSKDISYSKMTN